MWMVRAERGGRLVHDFIEGSFVGIGWTEVGDIGSGTPKEEILRRLEAAHPQEGEGTLGSWASQIKRYFAEIKAGNEVSTYDPGRRVYFLGTLEGDVHRNEAHELGLQRDVSWTAKVARDRLSASTRNSLGAAQALFLIPADAAAEMRSKAVGIEDEVTPLTAAEEEATDEGEEKEILDEVISKAAEFIEDRIARLRWRQMQELVAGLLEAMGYRARVSPEGGDRGVDIFASPDGLGLEQPRIFVEVKHRPGTTIGAQQVRAFIGGRQAGDRCLYVSTGGFTKEARYEADRSTVPLRLLSLPDLRELLTEHYPKLEAGVAAMVPLERIYWPSA